MSELCQLISHFDTNMRVPLSLAQFESAHLNYKNEERTQGIKVDAIHSDLHSKS